MTSGTVVFNHQKFSLVVYIFCVAQVKVQMSNGKMMENHMVPANEKSPTSRPECPGPLTKLKA